MTGLIFFHLLLSAIQEGKRGSFSTIPGQNRIFVQAVLIIKVMVGFTKPESAKMIQMSMSSLCSVMPVLDLALKRAVLRA